MGERNVYFLFPVENPILSMAPEVCSTGEDFQETFALCPLSHVHKPQWPQQPTPCESLGSAH